MIILVLGRDFLLYTWRRIRKAAIAADSHAAIKTIDSHTIKSCLVMSYLFFHYTIIKHVHRLFLNNQIKYIKKKTHFILIHYSEID